MTEHQLEPELHAITPRPVQRRPGHGSLITFVHLFILPHTVIGIGGLFVLLGSLAFAAFGTVVDGTVISTTEVRGNKGSRSYPTELSFDFNGRPERTKETLNSRPDVGATVQLRVLSIGGSVNTATEDSLGLHLLLVFLFVVFWNSVVGLAQWNLTFLPLRQKRLVREGLPTTGRVTKREEVRGSKGSKTWRISYGYVVEGVTLPGKMNVLEADYLALKEGDVVTVMFSEKKPQQSVIYRCAPYEVLRHAF